MAKKMLQTAININMELNDKMPAERALNMLQLHVAYLNKSSNDANARITAVLSDKYTVTGGE